MRPLDATREPGDAELDDAAVDYDGAARPFDQVERLHVRKRLEPDFDWLEFHQPSQRNALRMPVRDARIGLVVTAGVHLPDQRPARQIGEVRHIPVTASQVRLTHGGYDTQRAMRDPEVVFPARTLRRLAETGAIGSLAPIAASTMGYVPKGLNVLDRVVPPVVASMVSQQVDLALLVPA
ncbi:MAG TPA: glycine/sarcosine/betaine reductase selenoprotein B family protein [Actinomycetota bacterium]|nr:glycine/sarcosine/betaine reductase selenoprotein B family protein [Actinomycetota bacterium]